MVHPTRRRTRVAAFAVAMGLTGALAAPALGAPPPTQGNVNGFSYGELTTSAIGSKGCGTNTAGEPAIHVSQANDVFLGSEDGLGGGSELWRGLTAVGGPSANGCQLEYRGQPNAVGVGASGGDIDIALASTRNPLGFFNVYVASLNLASVNVATSMDRATTFTQVPVVEGIPVDDREWIAAYGVSTAVLTYHDIPTNNIDVLKSTNSGQTFVQTTTAIPPTDYKASNNELGNVAIDHLHHPTANNFWTYQVFVAPSSSSGSNFNEAFMSVSNDSAQTFTVHPIGCSTSTRSLDHNFPNVSVDPAGRVWAAGSVVSNI
jgi:hypothetical protein